MLVAIEQYNNKQCRRLMVDEDDDGDGDDNSHDTDNKVNRKQKLAMNVSRTSTCTVVFNISNERYISECVSLCRYDRLETY